MEQEYDIIIVGSGMGGLASAIILAKEGYRVCVLEKHRQFGGNLQTFSRDKTIFDTGVHYLGGLAEGQNLNQYFKYLGILEHLNLSKLDENGYDYVTFDNDPREYPHAQGHDNFVEQLSKFFPDEKEALARYSQEIQKVCESFSLYNLEKSSSYERKYLSTSVKDFLDGITDNENLKSVLAGSNLLYGGNGNKTPLYVHALSVNSYILSAWRCVFGGSQISKQLVKQFRKLGGTIHKRQEVTEFLFDGNNPIGAKTKGGTLYRGKLFISNIDLNATLKIVGKDKFRKAFIRRIEKLDLTPSYFGVYIKLKPQSFPYLNHNIYHFKDKQTVWNATEHDAANWPKSYMISMGIKQENQKYADNLSVLTYMDFDLVKKWENTYNTEIDEHDRGKDYRAFKEKHIEMVIDELEKKFPDFRSCIQSVYASTPLSYRDYIGGKEGNMYGFEKDAHRPLETFVYSKTKIPNLYLTGQTINMHGIVGTTIGAFTTCSEILGKEYLINKVKAEIHEKKN